MNTEKFQEEETPQEESAKTEQLYPTADGMFLTEQEKRSQDEEKKANPNWYHEQE